MSSEGWRGMTGPNLPPRLFQVRELTDAIDASYDLIADAKREHHPKRTYLLLSGGNDSMVLLDIAAHEVDAIVHVNTGIGIEETNEFVRQVCANRKLQLIELHPPIPYDDLVLGPWDGFPGSHSFAYGQLKRKAIDRFLATVRTDSKERFLLLTGLRRAESAIRRRKYTPVERRGTQVWANPLFDWSNEEMLEYRRAVKLIQNPVSAEMHMSGECLCGSRAHPGEREEWLFWRPDFIHERIEPLEAECQRLGKKYCKWGWICDAPTERQREIEGQGQFFMPMCVGCDVRG